MRTFLRTAALSVAFVVSAGLASAATLDFEGGAVSDEGFVDGVPLTVDGVDVTITSNTGCAYWDTRPRLGGIGAYGENTTCTTSGAGSDNWEDGETLTFTFLVPTKIESFLLYGNHEEFEGEGSVDVSLDGGSVSTVDVLDGLGSPDDNGFALAWTFSNLVGGGPNCDQGVQNCGYFGALTISEIPLPAAGWLLLGGLGGLAAMKRRRKS